MQNKILIVAVVAALLLAACQPAQTSPTSEASQPTSEASQPTSASQPADTEAPQAPAATAEPTQASQPVATGGEPMTGCRVVGSQLEANPTLEALFPAVNEKDWVKGPSDATVTIIDFSDFQ